MTEALAVRVRKAGQNGRRWYADLYFADGTVWTAWQYLFKSRQDMMQNIRCTFHGAVIEGTDAEVDQKIKFLMAYAADDKMDVAMNGRRFEDAPYAQFDWSGEDLIYA
jgi:hypothetical protein